MREIRLRAWDKKTKSMFNNAYVDLNYGKLELQMVKDAILLQYTGLKDKNGKEIYEGDLVKDRKGEKWIIEWCDQEVGWRLYKTFIYKNTTDVPSVVDFLDIEVIGNIYENPELVEK